MEDADGAQGTSQPGSPRRENGGPLDEASPGSLSGPAMANGNGFFYEHVPAEPESALEAAVQDVVVSDASAGKPPCQCSAKYILCRPLPALSSSEGLAWMSHNLQDDLYLFGHVCLAPLWLLEMQRQYH